MTAAERIARAVKVAQARWTKRQAPLAVRPELDSQDQQPEQAVQATPGNS